MTRSSVSDHRLPRLLALVPYLQARPGIRVEQAAADFGITEAQLRRDLQLLWMCGLPGHGPGDLIDLSFEGDTVSVIFDAGMSRPLRLSAEEALALAVALRTLAEAPGLTEPEAVGRALAKIETAAGGAVDASTLAVELGAVTRVLPTVQRALAESRALLMRYWTAARDSSSERTVDPLRLFDADSNAYLEAWCRRAEGVRVFRLDRIEHLELSDEPARPPAGLVLRELADGVYQPAAGHLLVELRVSPAYAWVADYYPSESVETVPARHPDGGVGDEAVRIVLRVSEPAWVRALVLGSGGQVEVLAPDWLADSIRTEAARALSSYTARGYGAADGAK